MTSKTCVYNFGIGSKFIRTQTKTFFAYLIDRQSAMCDTDQMICAV